MVRNTSSKGQRNGRHFLPLAPRGTSVVWLLGKKWGLSPDDDGGGHTFES